MLPYKKFASPTDEILSISVGTKNGDFEIIRI